MAVVFHEHNHTYESVDLFEKINWTGVTSLVGKYKAPFKAKEQSIKSSQNKKSKWCGMKPSDILIAWESERKRSEILGKWYHGEKETYLLSRDSIIFQGEQYGIQKPAFNADGNKIAPSQALIPGMIYPEHFVYLKSTGVCGQSDRVEVTPSKILNVRDYKTNKEIESTSYIDWQGRSKRMLAPLYHLDDCNLMHYALQLSIYAYIILKHNPSLFIGELMVEHVIFEEAGRDQYDNPITLLDKEGNPIIKEEVPYKVPYLKSEVELIFEGLKQVA